METTTISQNSDDQLKQFLEKHRLNQAFGELWELGVEIFDDIRYIDEDLLSTLKIKPIVRKRIIVECKMI